MKNPKNLKVLGLLVATLFLWVTPGICLLIGDGRV